MKVNIGIFIFSTIAALTSGETLRLTVFDRELNNTRVGLCNGEAARFGPTDDFYTLEGVVVLASPVNGCEPLRPPPYQRNDSLVWIALLARDSGSSGCFFDRKILNAQNAGFGAALVYNYENTISAMQASSLGDRVLIPAAMVTLTCGMLLQQQFVYSAKRGSRYRVEFFEYFNFDFNVYVISFVAIICASFVLFSVLWAFRWFRDWRIRQRSRLSKSSLKKLKVKKFEKGTDPYECCAICLEDFEPGDKLRILPCNHAYHMKCIDPWLLKSRSCCPVCKRRVFPRQPGEAAEEGDSDGEAAPNSTASGVAEAAAAAATAASATAASNAAAASSGAGNDPNGSGNLISGGGGGRNGERTPLLSSSAASSVTSGGSFGAVGTSVGRAAFDNQALNLQDELPHALAAVAAAESKQQQQQEQQPRDADASLTESTSTNTVSVSSLSNSADAGQNLAASTTASVEIVAEVCVHPAPAGIVDNDGNDDVSVGAAVKPDPRV